MMRSAMLAPILALAACGGGKSDERDTAAGKILPGSISDAMLQTDRLQSEAPLAAPKPVDGDAKPGAKAAKADDAAKDPEVPETPEAAVVATAAVAAPVPDTPPAP